MEMVIILQEKIVFQHVVARDVENPSSIDQRHCPHYSGCLNQDPGVRISEITYTDIHDASAMRTGINLDCSLRYGYGCTVSKFQDVKLTYKNQAASSYCSLVRGTTTSSFVQRSDCLQKAWAYFILTRLRKTYCFCL
ncbi:hypothetical protein MLD38_040616 [Melastoma candidum]|nr:hypothetical protein MLD38_040616 [Melastoma candidum]